MLVKGLEGMSCKKRLRTLGLSALKRFSAALCIFLSRGRGEGGAGLHVYSVRTDHSVRGNSTKLHQGRFIRSNFFTMRVANHWKRLPREAVAAPCLSVFK